jgi:molybdopterin-guanine dinucleotide biosynthesis protein B
VLQVVGYKNAGKTTLAGEIIRSLADRGLRVGALKSDAHGFEPDAPGKDTWRHRQAGAVVTAIASPARTAWFAELPLSAEEMVAAAQASPYALDALVLEGFKAAPYPKIVLLRTDADTDLLALKRIVAVVVRQPCPAGRAEAKRLGLPVYSAEGAERAALIERIADWMAR